MKNNYNLNKEEIY